MTQNSIRLTIEDKMNESVFLGPNDVGRPALIIEGTDDTWAYSYLFKLSRLRGNGDIDVVIGNGKETILKYHDEGQLSFQYVILLDADHDRWLDCCRQDENIVYTHYYSVESYFTSEAVVESTVDDFADVFTKDDKAKILLMEVKESLSPLYIATLMKLNNKWSIRLENCSINRWVDSQTGLIDPRKLGSYITEELKRKDALRESQNLYLAKAYEASSSNHNDQMVPFADIDRVVSGKQKLEAVYHLFRVHFPCVMEHRKLKVFRQDLVKNICRSEEAVSLVEKIDSILEKLLEDRAHLRSMESESAFNDAVS